MQIYVCVKHVPDSAANIHLVDQTTIDQVMTKVTQTERFKTDEYYRSWLIDKVLLTL